MQKILYKIEYFIFLILKYILLKSPKFFRTYFLKFLTFAFYIIISKYRKIVKKNLEIAFNKDFSEKNYKKFTKKCISNLLENIITVIENIDRSSKDISEIVEFENRGIVDDILKDNKSIIFSSGHFNNWEILVTAVASQISKGFGVAEKLKNSYLDKVLTESRENFRITVVPMKGALRGLIKAIKNDFPIFVIMDQAVNIGQGIEKNFFDFPAIHSDINQYLSKKYDLYIVPTYIRKENGIYKIRFEEPFKSKHVKDSLDRELTILENKIRESPESWLWCHRRWKNHKEIYS